MSPDAPGWYLLEKTNSAPGRFNRFVRYWDGDGWKSTTREGHQTADSTWKVLGLLIAGQPVVN